MSTSNPNSNNSIHHLVQLSYTSSLLSGQSVLLVSSDFSIASFIASTGANVVAASREDASPPWPRLRSEDGMAHHIMPLNNLAFDDGVFGAAVIPNISEINDLEAVLSEIKRVLHRNGRLIAATPNANVKGNSTSAIDYYRMYDLLSKEFPSVQMIGQSPFIGYTVADLEGREGSLEVSFNSDLLESEVEDISWFVAVCAERKCKLDSYSVIQIPSSSFAVSADSADLERLEEELKNARIELGNRGVRIESLEKKLEEELMQSEAARDRAVKLSKELDNERKSITKKTLEDEFSKRSNDIDLAGLLQSAKKELKLALERAQSAEAARDDIIDRMRADAQELDRLRQKISNLETKPKKDIESEKKYRLALERAESAEAARDDLIDRFREDARELERLRERRHESGAIINTLKARETALVEEITSLRSEFEPIRKESASLKEENNSLKTSAEQLKKDADLLRTALETLKKETDLLRSELETLRGEKVILNTRLIEAENKLNLAQATEQTPVTTAPPSEDLSALEKENQELERKLEETAEKKRSAEEECSRLSATLRDLIVKMESMSKSECPEQLEPQAQQVDCSEQIRTLEAEIAALWGAKAGEHRARVEAELELTQRMMELKQIKNSLAEANIQLKMKDEEIKRILELQNSIKEDQKKSAGETDENSRRREMRIAELESDLQSAKWRIGELEARKTELERQTDLSVAELEKVQNENQRFASTLEAAKRRERMLDDEANALSNRSKTLKAELDEANNRVVALAEELSSAQREREKLAETLHEMTRLLDEEKNQKAQNDELLRKTQEEAEELRVKIRIAEVELVGAHNKISDLSKVADTLKDESGRMAEVMDALERRQTEIAMLREQAATTETALENEQKHNANLACELDAVKEKLQKEMELARLAGADAARLSGELDECKAKLEINIEALAERDSEIEANLIIISTLKIEFDELSKKLEDARTANVQLDSVQRELAIKDAQLAEKTEILSDRESVIAQKDALLSEKESLIAEKDALLSEKESLIAEKDALLSEKSVALVEKDTLLSEKDVELTEKAASFAEFLKTIDSFKEREQALEAELNERKKDLEETAGAMSKMEEKVIALNQSKVGMSMELADAIQTSERLNSEIAEYKTRQAEQESQIADLKNKLEKAKNQAIEQSDAVMQLKRLSGDVLNLQKSLSEKTALVDSLTEQLEDRQQRASKLERQNKDLSERIKEHEGDTAAWDMELKLRSARISQLEKELAEALNK